MNRAHIEQELRALPSFNRPALIDRQAEALRKLEVARKNALSTRGKPRCIQALADEQLLDAIAEVEEFNALELEAV